MLVNSVSTYGFPSTTAGALVYFGAAFFSVAAGGACYCYYFYSEGQAAPPFYSWWLATPPLEIKSSTSFLVMDPSIPVPVIPSKETPCSLAKILANGDTKSLVPSWAFGYYYSYFGYYLVYYCYYCSYFGCCFCYYAGWDCVTDYPLPDSIV